jgi:hypothetical protein
MRLLSLPLLHFMEERGLPQEHLGGSIKMPSLGQRPKNEG